MKSINKPIAPEEYSTVCPYIMVENVEEELDFLSKVFDARILDPIRLPDGTIMHGEAKIEEVIIMLGKAQPGVTPSTSMNYVFTLDVDKSYTKALSNGAKSLMKPSDQFYGFRECGVEDPQGNQWWIVKKIEEVSTKEIQQRMNELSNKK